jgi:hypothetical protein
MWRRLAAGTIGLVLATSGGAIVQAGGHPDLKLDFVGVNPTDTRGLEFRITNIGDAPASAGSAHAETISPNPGNVVQPNYPAIEPGKSVSIYYYLTEPCDGHVVKVGVSAVGDGEGEYGNNFFQGQVCAKIPPPPPPPPPAPAEKKPVSHTKGFPPTLVRNGHRWHNSSDIGCAFLPGYNIDEAVVGWRQNDELLCSQARAFQTALKFDLSPLANKKITRAVLTFDEYPQKWTDGETNARDVSGCVTILAYATTDWSGQPEDGPLFPNDPFTSKQPFGDQDWFVTQEVEQLVSGARPNHGFVLRSHREADQGHDDDSCESVLKEIELIVTWEEPS